MGTTRNTGYLQNIVQYDASNNITLPANLTVTGSIVGYATTSYVTTQINNLINGAPGLLDTLDELAAALGDDANFAATITTSLAGKQSTLTFTGPLVNTSGTITITQSSGSTNGFLSNTDWTTFNSKQSTLTFSGPLVNTSGTISITQSSGSTNGYLSNTDWTTFNNKQAALSGTGFVKISGTTISYDNSTYLTTASATSTYLPLAGGTLTGNLGIGNTASYLLDVYAVSSGSTSTMFRLKNGYNDPSTGLRMRWDFASLPGAYLDIITDSSGHKSMYLSLSSANAAPTQVFQIVGSTGAATFSNSITSAGLNLNAGGVININSLNGFQLGADSASGGFYVYDNTNSVYRLKISNAGATVLSGALTIGGAFSTGSPIYSSSGTPFTFTNNGNSGTYTQTTIYVNQNNTSGDTANGIFIERGRLSDAGGAEVRNFIIGARGGSIQWRLDSTGNSFQTGTTTGTDFNAVNNRNYFSRGALRLTSASNNASTLDISVTDSTTNIYSNYFSGGNDNTLVIGTYAYNSNQLVLKSSGNVGVGIANPNARLDLGGSYGASGEKFFIYNDNTSSALAGTKVGFYMDRFGLANNSTYVFPTSSANPGSYVMASKDTGDTTLVARVTVFGETGFVGIGTGTSSISNRLQVSGNIYSTDTIFARNLKPEAFAGPVAGSPTGATIPLGYSSMNISMTSDNTWRPIMNNINDVKGYFWVTLGDAASKDTAHYFMAMTSPAYGVYNFGTVSYQDNGWNTGNFEFSYDSSGGTFRLLVRFQSYYNSSNTAYGTIYFLRME